MAEIPDYGPEQLQGDMPPTIVPAARVMRNPIPALGEAISSVALHYRAQRNEASFAQSQVEANRILQERRRQLVENGEDPDTLVEDFDVVREELDQVVLAAPKEIREGLAARLQATYDTHLFDIQGRQLQLQRERTAGSAHDLMRSGMAGVAAAQNEVALLDAQQQVFQGIQMLEDFQIDDAAEIARKRATATEMILVTRIQSLVDRGEFAVAEELLASEEAARALSPESRSRLTRLLKGEINDNLAADMMEVLLMGPNENGLYGAFNGLPGFTINDLAGVALEARDVGRLQPGTFTEVFARIASHREKAMETAHLAALFRTQRQTGTGMVLSGNPDHLKYSNVDFAEFHAEQVARGRVNPADYDASLMLYQEKIPIIPPIQRDRLLAGLDDQDPHRVVQSATTIARLFEANPRFWDQISEIKESTRHRHFAEDVAAFANGGLSAPQAVASARQLETTRQSLNQKQREEILERLQFVSNEAIASTLLRVGAAGRGGDIYRSHVKKAIHGFFKRGGSVPRLFLSEVQDGAERRILANGISAERAIEEEVTARIGTTWGWVLERGKPRLMKNAYTLTTPPSQISGDWSFVPELLDREMDALTLVARTKFDLRGPQTWSDQLRDALYTLGGGDVETDEVAMNVLEGRLQYLFHFMPFMIALRQLGDQPEQEIQYRLESDHNTPYKLKELIERDEQGNVVRDDSDLHPTLAGGVRAPGAYSYVVRAMGKNLPASGMIIPGFRFWINPRDHEEFLAQEETARLRSERWNQIGSSVRRAINHPSQTGGIASEIEDVFRQDLELTHALFQTSKELVHHAATMAAERLHRIWRRSDIGEFSQKLQQRMEGELPSSTSPGEQERQILEDSLEREITEDELNLYRDRLYDEPLLPGRR